jgi:hypothetical protein
VFLPLHNAELAAIRLLEWNVDDVELNRDAEGVPHEMEQILAAREADTLRLRTYVIRANDYKERLAGRQACDTMIREYRSCRMAEFVVVTEFVETEGHEDSHRCLGEVVFDSTSNPKNPWVHVLRLGSTVSMVKSDGSEMDPFGLAISDLIPGAMPYRHLEEKGYTEEDRDGSDGEGSEGAG